MKRDSFRKIETEEEVVELLKKHGLYREDDVVFDSFGHGNMYVYVGDDFAVDEELLSELECSAIVVEGSVHADLFSVSQILGDLGIFCVTGDLSCHSCLVRVKTQIDSIGWLPAKNDALHA